MRRGAGNTPGSSAAVTQALAHAISSGSPSSTFGSDTKIKKLEIYIEIVPKSFFKIAENNFAKIRLPTKRASEGLMDNPGDLSKRQR